MFTRRLLKMKAKVLRRFIDIKTKKAHEVGEVFQLTKARYDEIISNTKKLVEAGRLSQGTQLIEEVKEKATAKKK